MKIKLNNLVLLAAIIGLMLTVCGYAASHQEAMGFEVAENVWVTEADLSEFSINDLWCERVTPGSYLQLRNAVSLSTVNVKQGQYSLKWARHNEYPSLTTTAVPSDWSGFNTVTFWIYSQTATNQQVCFVVHSDSGQTVWKDFYYKPFKVDWTGWKKFDLPLSELEKYETVAGLGKIDGVGFYTKLFNARPNPYTVLYLDDMRLENIAAADINRDGKSDMKDFSFIADQWLLKIAAGEDFEQGQIDAQISTCGWYGLYGALTADCVIAPSELGGRKAAIVYGKTGGRYRRDFTGNNLTAAEENVYISADITPVKYASVCNDIWAGFWAQFHAGAYVGFMAAGNGTAWQAAVMQTGGSTSVCDSQYAVTSGHTYRLRLQMNTISGTGSLYIMDMTAGDTDFTPLAGLQNVDLKFTTSNNPTKWVKFYFQAAKNGSLDNLVLGSGQLSTKYPPLKADIDSDRRVGLTDVVIFAETWLEI